MGRLRVRPYKPGKYGKGLIQSEAAPQAMIWRIGGGWNGEPHHAEVSDTLKIARPNIAFHIGKDRRFYFHSEDAGFVHPHDPARLARQLHGQYPKLSWGKLSAEEYERAHGMREGKRTLAMNSRPLRPFERGAHLHVLDWAHDTARYRLQAAGAVQVKAAARSIVQGDHPAGPPNLPALQAAMSGELRKLYALGHATVRSELDHQRSGRALPVGLSEAPSPPNLRPATGATERCGTCRMFDNGVCWGYGNYGVEPDEVCDSWATETVRTLAAAPAPKDPGRLRARAALIAADVGHQVWLRIHRARLQGITDQKTLRRLGREAGASALSQGASQHAGGAISAGRHSAALESITGGGEGGPASEIVGARYTSVLDKATCGPCAQADTGQLVALDSPEWIPTPNPACLGGDRCRCVHVYQLASEAAPARRPDVPAAGPEVPTGDGTLPRDVRPIAQVGVGSS